MRAARFSGDRVYRYTLDIEFDSGIGVLNFIMLNPSTADEFKNDPTVERCERRARAWGYRWLTVTNLFAFRSTDPRAMKAAVDPVGPENDAAILDAARTSDLVIAAWGNHGIHRGRAGTVCQSLRSQHVRLRCLRVASTGQPCHPLYLPYELEPIDYGGIVPNTQRGWIGLLPANDARLDFDARSRITVRRSTASRCPAGDGRIRAYAAKTDGG